MSSYLVLARKYRPQNFDELVGQEVLVKTLTNAIKNNRLHHAYILHGIRGIGKTTTARIIAKTLNCQNDEMRLEGKACGICKNCIAIANSHHQDVFEIDAASRTGVGDVREIIDSIAYSPVEARFKIYIIDEFHMMSDSAFNALLKTLEEPPVNVKFIFATTEIREVPKTILSRCQRFNLRRLDDSEIVSHLTNILKKEAFEADEKALKLIAKYSEGSVRDSLSILDQALANNNHQSFLSSDIIEQMLGLSDGFVIIELLECLLKGDIIGANQNFYKIYQNSSDINQLVKDLLNLIHKISFIKLVNNCELDSYSKNQIDKLKEISQTVDISNLIRVWQLISKSTNEIFYSNSSKIHFEMLIIKICHLIAIPDLKKILLNLHNENSNSENSNYNLLKDSLVNTDKISELSSSNKIEQNPDLVADILKNFEGSKIF